MLTDLMLPDSKLAAPKLTVQPDCRSLLCSPATRAILAALLAATLGLVGGCKSTEEAPPEEDYSRYSRPLAPGTQALAPIPRAEYPDLAYLYPHRMGGLRALERSLQFFAAPSSRNHFPFRLGDRTITHGDQVASLERMSEILESAESPNELSTRLKEEFDFYRSVGWDGYSGEVLFTGYYTPEFRGSLTPNEKFRYPLYRKPQDLVVDRGVPRGRRTRDGAVVPYYTREEIEEGRLLAGQELVYLADPFEVFIVHVQGSASIQLTDGAWLHVGYAGKTDRPYSSVRASLVQQSLIEAEAASLSTMKQFFAKNPQDLDILYVNESYVFFTERDEPGPAGSLGVEVTALHTIATDKQVFPRGGPVIVRTHLPQVGPRGEPIDIPHTGLYFDQDTGGAIRSAGRADLYLGRGVEAEQVAGFTRHEGQLYYLFLKRDDASRR